MDGSMYDILIILIVSIGSSFLCSCGNNDTPVYGYEIVNVYPHDRDAFTQGLVYQDGVFYEGTGLNGQSSLRKVDPVTGKVKQIHYLPSYYFGEGITILGDKIYQLTWRSGICLVYDKKTFEPIHEFHYSGEGWGLTNDGRFLIMSNGSPALKFIDPDTFEVVKTVTVKHGTKPISRLNELEYIEGEIWANIWIDDRIVRINPETGAVTGWVDLSGLLEPSDLLPSHRIDVLNGIAYDSKTKRLFVTGKFWPKLFEIRIIK